MPPDEVCVVLAQWGGRLKAAAQKLSCNTEHHLGPDSENWAAVRFLQNTRACDSFATFLLPFVKDAMGEDVCVQSTRMWGGMSFRIIYAGETRQLTLFNRVDVEGIEINAHAVVSERPPISTK